MATLGSRRGTAPKKRAPLSDLFLNPPDQARPAPSRPDPVGTGQLPDTAKALRLVESLLPMAAHLIPLPEDDGEELDLADEMDVVFEELVRGLEEGGLKVVVSTALKSFPTDQEMSTRWFLRRNPSCPRFTMHEIQNSIGGAFKL